MKNAARAIAIMTSIALLLTVLAACNPSNTSSSSSTTTLTVATVNNSQMVQMEQLTKQVFQKDHPNIKVNFVTLPENDLRSKVTQDVATNAGKFDVATIGSYETPIWAHNGWIQDLTPYFGKMSASDKSSYNYDDLLKPVMSTLSYQGHAYAVPFYGESSFLMYNKQIFAQHHLTMPLHPTWGQVAQLAQQLNDPAAGVTGILLRGQAGWGMNMAPLDTMINTFGGRWFDSKWQPLAVGVVTWSRQLQPQQGCRLPVHHLGHQFAVSVPGGPDLRLGQCAARYTYFDLPEPQLSKGGSFRSSYA